MTDTEKKPKKKKLATRKETDANMIKVRANHKSITKAERRAALVEKHA